MDISEFRKQNEELVKGAHEKRRERRSYFMERFRSSAGGLESVPSEADAIKGAAQIIWDKAEDVERRVSALREMATDVGKSHDWIDRVIELLKDNSQPSPLRLAALEVLQRASFRASIFAPKRPDYIAALRGILNEPDAALRQQAIEILAQEKDEYAQRKLLEGLQKPAGAIVSPEHAIQLLGYDVHAAHYPILKQIVQNPPSREAREEAVRVLASDATSKQMFVNMLRDKAELPEIRKISAAALQSLAPEEFEKLAREMVMDRGEDDTLRATTLSALDHFADPKSLSEDAGFLESVEQLRDKSPSKEVEHSTEQYLSKRKKP